MRNFIIKKLETNSFFFKLINFIRLFKYKQHKNVYTIHKNISENIIEKKILDELSNNGFFVLENFISYLDCRIIIKSIDEFIDDNPKKVWKDQNNSDNRIHGAENINSKINNISNNLFPLKIGSFYMGKPLKLFMTMANRLIYKENNLGSGGGWHKDSYASQFKSILYLNEVTNENGPFQFIKKSNKLFSDFKVFFNLKKKFPDTRFSNKEISKFVNNDDEKIVTVIGKAGTLILVDTSLIHRGCPIEKECRYALTNYYYPSNQTMELKQFQPIIRNKLF